MNNKTKWLSCSYQQESPPTWRQEAYCLPHSCSVSQSPGWGESHHTSLDGRTLSSPDWGTRSSPDEGGVPPSSPNGGGYPNPVLTRGYPNQEEQGTPCWEGWGTPCWEGWGTPCWEGWSTPTGKDGYYPPSGRMGLPLIGKDGAPLLGGWGTPFWVWTDTQSENMTFCHPSDAGGKNMREWTVLQYLCPAHTRSRVNIPVLVHKWHFWP